MTEDDSAFHIDFSTGKRFNLDAIRQQQSAFMPDNSHAWVIHTVYAVDDPDEAMDTMELDERNFVGVSPIYCLLCTTKYEEGVNRHHKCPQVANA